MILPPIKQLRSLETRAENLSEPGSYALPLIISLTVVVSATLIIVLSFCVLRRLRIQDRSPRYIPTQYLKRKWKKWVPISSGAYGQVPNGPAGQHATNNAQNQDTSYGGAGADAAVDRQTSIRSVMTLPSYTPVPKATEQVVGREGERGGMDVVVEFPETGEEEESRREEQMESLYQIRLARRREIAEREERRRQRREARERGDWARVEQLRRESRARAEQERSSPNGSNVSLSAATLMAEHQSRARERRISAVDYAEVGHVRHDGTRLRASSPDSDSRPLLDAAAGMGGDTYDSRNPSIDGPTSLGTTTHTRGRSRSSTLSHETRPSASLPRGSSSSAREPQGTGADISEAGIPPPPEYEQLDWGEAPPYQSPIRERGDAPQLPALHVVPSIEVENATPASSAPPTPRERVPGEGAQVHAR